MPIVPTEVHKIRHSTGNFPSVRIVRKQRCPRIHVQFVSENVRISLENVNYFQRDTSGAESSLTQRTRGEFLFGDIITGETDVTSGAASRGVKQADL